MMDAFEMIEYLVENGFVFVSNANQRQVAEELVRAGHLQPVPSEWMKSSDGYYVSAKIPNKNHMPVSLHPMIYPDPEYKDGEVVKVELQQSNGLPIYVFGQITREPWVDGRGESRVRVSVIGTMDEVVVPTKNIMKTTSTKG